MSIKPLCKHMWPKMVAALQAALADSEDPHHLRGVVGAWFADNEGRAPLASWACPECEAAAQEQRTQRAVKRAAKKARNEADWAKWK